jgi:hypothetical protein
MAVTTGTVSFIKVVKPSAGEQDFCLFGLIATGGTQAEQLILWSSPPPITAAQWVVNNATLLMLREAYASQTAITVTTSGNSGVVTQIQVGQV